MMDESSFWNKTVVKPDTGCLVWVGWKTMAGYGKIRVGKKGIYAHRVAYELSNGPITDGLFVCHRCDNPSCVNPDHLFLGTNRDNILDAKSKGRLPDHLTTRAKSLRKLGDDDVRAIRQMFGLLPARELATRFGVDPKTIYQVAARERYVDVSDDAHVMDRLDEQAA